MRDAHPVRDWTELTMTGGERVQAKENDGVLVIHFFSPRVETLPSDKQASVSSSGVQRVMPYVEPTNTRIKLQLCCWFVVAVAMQRRGTSRLAIKFNMSDDGTMNFETRDHSISLGCA